MRATEGLHKATSSVMATIGRATSVLAAFWGGWRGGEKIAQMTGLGKALDALLIPAKLVANSIASIAAKTFEALTGSAAAARKELDEMAKASDRVVAKLAGLNKTWTVQADDHAAALREQACASLAQQVAYALKAGQCLEE